MARSSQYWIFQERDVMEPWAIHVTMHAEGRKTRYDLSLFAEWLDNDSKKYDLADLKSANTLVQSVAWICEKHGKVFDTNDEMQIRSDLKLLKENLQ